jgi:hypothetical protein
MLHPYANVNRYRPHQSMVKLLQKVLPVSKSTMAHSKWRNPFQDMEKEQYRWYTLSDLVYNIHQR